LTSGSTPCPFALSKKEEWEIRQIARLLFGGGNPALQEETRELWRKWRHFFDVFVYCRDARYGNLLHFPFSGGAFEQPVKTMEAIGLIQNLYIKHIQDKQEEANRKIGSGARPRRFVKKRR
jgi:hypothetical protein